VSGLAEELVRMGHEVTVVTSNLDLTSSLDVDCDGDRLIDGVRVRYFRVKPVLPFMSQTGITVFGPEFNVWLCREGELFDVFDSQIAFCWGNRACSRFATRQRSVYLYHQRANLDPVRLSRGWLKKYAYITLIEWQVMRRADALIALTEHEAASFRRLGLSNRIEVVPNGIDPNFGRNGGDLTGSLVRECLRKLGDDLVFLFMGRIHTTKGCDLFVEAFCQCAEYVPGIQAVLTGPDEQGLVDSLRARVSAAGLEKRFHYLGAVQGSDKISVLRRCDCFVLPTLSEGMSMAILEALVCGSPVLTTPGAYFDEITRVGAGEVVERSTEALVSGMIRICQRGRSGLRAMGEKGRQFVLENYCWANVANKYLALCEELLNKAGGGSKFKLKNDVTAARLTSSA
jgi:glycosyltransferase involved in cell wall biosynthesis